MDISEFPTRPPETISSTMNKQPRERIESEENPPPPKRIKRTRSNQKSSLIAKMLTVSVATTAVVIAPSILPETVNVDFLEISSSATTVSYELQVEETDSDLILVLQNEFTEREIPLTVGINTGRFDQLASDMNYTLIVKKTSGLNPKVDSRTIRTKKEDPPAPPPPPMPSPPPTPMPPPPVLITEFLGLTYTSAETPSGTFTFTPQYVDEKGIWSNITAHVTDLGEYGSLETTITESETTYYLDLSQAQFVTSKATLTLFADVLQEDGSTKNEQIYMQTVDLTETATYVQNVSVVPARYYGGTVDLTVDYIDENRFWMGEGLLCKLYGDSLPDPMIVEGQVWKPGGVGYLSFPEGFVTGETAVLELIATIEVGQEYAEVVVYRETIIVKSEDFNPNYDPNNTGDYAS